MNDMRTVIKDAIEKQIGNGDWNGISVADGRYEGSMTTLDIDAETIEVEDNDLISGTISVFATGTGTATHKDADSKYVTDEYEVTVRAKVNIGITGAAILNVVNNE